MARLLGDLPNEILHHHGPLSDLERYPTLNLKFDKEIPDVFEHLMFGAGRLVLHVADERKAIVLDTVLHVSHKEDALKKLMSRLEVRVTTDQEVASTHEPDESNAAASRPSPGVPGRRGAVALARRR